MLPAAAALILGLQVAAGATPLGGHLRGAAQSAAPQTAVGERLLAWSLAQAKAARVLSNASTEELYALLRGTNFSIATMSPDLGYYTGNIGAIPSLGVPALKMQDAAQGFRVMTPGYEGTTTAWPCLLAMASTWDEELVDKFGTALAAEFRGKGANVILGPSINVHRVARNGRNFEYMSGEDPYLGSRLTATYVKAVQRGGVMATAKHFAFNQQETHRMTEDSVLDARTAWELYYPPFEAAVKAGVGSIMCAYNKVNGTYACENSETLQRDLQGTMGFQGFVMSDWGATHNTTDIEHGLQVEMPGVVTWSGSTYGHFSGNHLDNVSRAAVNDAAARVLTSVYHVRLEEEEEGCQVTAENSKCLPKLHSDQATEAHRALARTVATRAVTLLKNDGALPIDGKKVKTIAVVGPAANATVKEGTQMDYYAGGGSGKVVPQSVVTPLQGIQRRAKAAGVSVLVPSVSTYEADIELAKKADLVIVVGATSSAEGSDRPSLNLDDQVDLLISAIADVKPTVVLMQTPGAVLTPWRSKVSAIANLFLAGEETGSAWASVLFGDVSPAGKLPIMLPESEADTIFPNPGLEVTYSEGVFTSYRSPTFKAAFPFGHGLSYTTFEYGPAEQVTGADCEAAACVRLKVTNTGERTGAEVVQAYVRFPADASQPHQVLKGFHRTRELGKGGKEEVLLAFTARDLSVYKDGGWQRQGEVQVAIGASSADIKQVVELQGSA